MLAEIWTNLTKIRHDTILCSAITTWTLFQLIPETLVYNSDTWMEMRTRYQIYTYGWLQRETAMNQLGIPLVLGEHSAVRTSPPALVFPPQNAIVDDPHIYATLKQIHVPESIAPTTFPPLHVFTISEDRRWVEPSDLCTCYPEWVIRPWPE